MISTCMWWMSAELEREGERKKMVVLVLDPSFEILNCESRISLRCMLSHVKASVVPWEVGAVWGGTRQ